MAGCYGSFEINELKQGILWCSHLRSCIGLSKPRVLTNWARPTANIWWWIELTNYDFIEKYSPSLCQKEPYCRVLLRNELYSCSHAAIHDRRIIILDSHNDYRNNASNRFLLQHGWCLGWSISIQKTYQVICEQSILPFDEVEVGPQPSIFPMVCLLLYEQFGRRCMKLVIMFIGIS